MLIDAHPYHVEELMLRMRKEDQRELIEMAALRHYHPPSAEEVIKETWVSLLDEVKNGTYVAASTTLYGTMIALMGIRFSTEYPGGVCWMLGTELADEHPVTFTRDCKEMIGRVSRETYLWNIMPEWAYEKRKGWLEFLGFDYIWQNRHFARCKVVMFANKQPSMRPTGQPTAPISDTPVDA